MQLPRCLPLLGLLLVTLTLACAQQKAETAAPSDERKAKAATPPAREALTAADLEVWPTVDTTTTEAAGALAALRRFFDEKNNRLSADEQTYWASDDFERFRRDYSEIRYAEYSPDVVITYLPTVVQLDEIAGKPDDRLVTVRWARVDSTGTPADIHYVFTFWAQLQADGDHRLRSPTPVLAQDFTQRTVGRITYHVSPRRVFSPTEAKAQLAALEQLDSFFGVAPFPITYYSFRDPAELLRTRGYVVHPLAYVHPTGGQAGVGDVVYSGNDRDSYTHEVVHLYLQRTYPQSAGLLNEGLATLLGGSGGEPHAVHAERLRQWLEDNPSIALSDYLNPYAQQYIEEQTPIPYAIGATLCRYLIDEHGREALDAALGAGREFWDVLEVYGVTKQNLRDVLTVALRKG